MDWPQLPEVEYWDLSKKIKLTKIHYKHMHDNKSLGALRFEFSNEMQSPPFEAPGVRHMCWHTIDIDQTKRIKKVSMYVENYSGNLNKLKLIDNDDKEMCNVNFRNVPEEMQNGKWVD